MPYIRVDISPSLAHLPWREKFLAVVHPLAAQHLGVPPDRMKSTITVAQDSLIGLNTNNTVGGHVYIQLFCFIGRDVQVRTEVSELIAAEVKKMLHGIMVPISTAVYVLEIPKEGATVRIVDGSAAT